MDPITAAIVAALFAGASAGITDVSKKAIVEGYEALKAALKRRFGSDSKLVEALDELEGEPDFKPNQETVAGRVAQVKATDDPEFRQLAQALLDKIKAQPGGDKIIITTIGERSVGISGDVIGGTIITGNSGKPS
jgi:hypothetical protein